MAQGVSSIVLQATLLIGVALFAAVPLFIKLNKNGADARLARVVITVLRLLLVLMMRRITRFGRE
jgi:hypothetical protein